MNTRAMNPQHNATLAQRNGSKVSEYFTRHHRGAPVVLACGRRQFNTPRQYLCNVPLHISYRNNPRVNNSVLPTFHLGFLPGWGALGNCEITSFDVMVDKNKTNSEADIATHFVVVINFTDNIFHYEITGCLNIESMTHDSRGSVGCVEPLYVRDFVL